MTTVGPEELVPPSPYKTTDRCDWCDREARWIGLDYTGFVSRACALHRINLRETPEGA